MLNRYRVHSANEESIEVEATMADGTPVAGRLRVLVVELVSDRYGTITHKEVIANDEERKAARERFAVGAVIEVALNRVEAAPKA